VDRVASGVRFAEAQKSTRPLNVAAERTPDRIGERDAQGQKREVANRAGK
jgi:hypothetical protein